MKKTRIGPVRIVPIILSKLSALGVRLRGEPKRSANNVQLTIVKSFQWTKLTGSEVGKKESLHWIVSLKKNQKKKLDKREMRQVYFTASTIIHGKWKEEDKSGTFACCFFLIFLNGRFSQQSNLPEENLLLISEVFPSDYFILKQNLS